MWTASKPEEFPIYSQPDSTTMKKLMDKIPSFLQNVAKVLEINSPNEILVCQETLYEILTRVENRRVYFHIYYNGKRMGERNEGALICFWILFI